MSLEEIQIKDILKYIYIKTECIKTILDIDMEKNQGSATKDMSMIELYGQFIALKNLEGKIKANIL